MRDNRAARVAVIRGGRAATLDKRITRCPRCDQRVLPPEVMDHPHEDVCPGLESRA